MATPINADDIAPAPEAETPAPAPVEEAAPAEEGAGLPDALLEAAPALQLLMQGSPPATFAAVNAEFPEIETVSKHVKDLGEAGFGIYPTADGVNLVVFNGLYITPEEVKAADEAGQLDQIAVPYEELRSAFGAEPVKGAVASAPPPPSGSPPPNPTTGKKLTTARVKNLSVGAPTSGPVPGQGRIMNSILKPVV